MLKFLLSYLFSHIFYFAVQVARRYEELLYSGELFVFDQFEKNMGGQGVTIPSSMSDLDLVNKSSRPSSANKQKGTSIITIFLWL